MIQAVERLQLIFKRLSDLIGHTFSAGAWIRHDHGDGRDIDVW